MLLFDVVYLIFLVLALPLWAKFLLKKEYRKILKHRLSPGIAYSKEKRIWIHAVSVGEVRSLKYLIEQLKEK
jgi:3-deoxy-D-manno-octulosonic-acid transferase